MTPAAQSAWRRLEALARRPVDLRALFAQNPARAEQWALEGGGVFLDSSKSLADDEALAGLHSLARAAGATERLRAQRRGEAVNFTERRAAWHSALRAPSASASAEAATAQRELQRMLQFAEAVRVGQLHSVAGQPFSRIVHIGIGGSHLGPELLHDALRRPELAGPEIRFVANADPAALSSALRDCAPASTMVVCVSKSFSTGETLENARAAKGWLERALGADDAARHLAAATANPEAAVAFGVARERVFEFADWVGGRYSLWSTVSLSAAAAIGAEQFQAFLQGGGEMDAHAAAAPLEKNLPLRLALLGIWHCNFLGAQTHCVAAYQHRLRGLARYLQQLAMESNGKRVGEDGEALAVDTGEILWGGEGSNDQHSYFQLLAQGARLVPMDFVVAAQPEDAGDAEAHGRLLSHALGWSRALMRGRSFAEAEAAGLAKGLPPAEAKRLAAHQACPGNRPSNMIVIPKLTARALGALVALYEHKTALQSFVWGVNAFDQWGVESGKRLTGEIARAMAGEAAATAALDPSTRMLLGRLHPPGAGGG